MNAILTAHVTANMVTAQIEPNAEEFIRTVMPMLDAHYRELSVHRMHGFRLNPDISTYLEMASKGRLLAASLRQDSEIVGYFFGFIGPALHYQDCLTLSMDIMYVTKAARGSKGHAHGATILFDCVEAEARRRGVRQIRVGSKIHRGRHTAALYEQRRYIPEETYWSLWLEDSQS